MEIFDPASGRWSTGKPQPITLYGVSAAVIRDSIYIFGGSDRAATENFGCAFWLLIPEKK